MARGLAALDEHWSYERDGGTHIQASESPVWDTLFCLLAMVEAGHKLARHAGDAPGAGLYPRPSDSRARRLVADRQGRRAAAAGRSSAPISAIPMSTTPRWLCWFWPSCAATSGDLRARVEFAIERALAWVWGMQSANGGWAAFDRDNDKAIISKIPFCNFGEALDPPSVDVTAHVIEALGRARHAPGRTRNRQGAGLHLCRAGAGGLMVRTLGRQPHLRDRRGSAGARRDRRGHERAPHPQGGGLAGRPSRTPTAAGARAANPIWTPTGSAAARARLRRPPGR